MAATGTSVSLDVFPPDFSTTVGRIRMLIPDFEQVDYTGEGAPEYMFSDAYLENLHEISAGRGAPRIYRAAAAALRAVAVSEGLIQKVIRTEDLQTDGAKLASALMAGAKAWEERAEDMEEGDSSMMIVDFQPVPQDGFPYTLHGFPTAWTAGPGSATTFARWL